MYRPGPTRTCGRESQNVSLIEGAESFSRRQTSGLAHHP
ncbi:hypothetical protein BZL30_4674 [Mycobacterium kansasii]|uniref:Uncharacterized protein n=1 Tax=Mycobacterium kansasii TaxID=1768 RepID=A0A1V3X2W5_MYCKA|nr:hypothetical protein BZL30_4674 [Mycobacterium kansasii]